VNEENILLMQELLKGGELWRLSLKKFHHKNMRN